MSSVDDRAALSIPEAAYRAAYDRVPLQFTHNLHELDMFQPDSLLRLAGLFTGHKDDYFVASSAPSPGTNFYSVPHGAYEPRRAMDELANGAYRILLKRPETYDPRFKALLDRLFRQVTDLRGGLGGEKIVRLESAVFISSAASTTPFHFDPEVNHFAQIEGEKSYHVYSPDVVAEHELDRHYVKGEVNIGQIALEGRDPAKEHVFRLLPGRGFHQPQDAPHWVRTGVERSVSYSFVYETDVSRARGRARSANHYMRMMGLSPQQPGVNPGVDTAKSGLMQVVTPVRRTMRRTLHKTLGRS
jgi:hypothetical protein